MASAAQNLQTAIAAVASVAGKLTAAGVERVYLFGPKAKGTDTPSSTWDFIVDLNRPISFNEYSAINNALLLGIKEADKPSASIYTTSPQYDRPSFTAYAVKSSKLVYPV